MLAAQHARQHGLVADSSSSGGSLLAVRHTVSCLLIALSGNSQHVRSDLAPSWCHSRLRYRHALTFEYVDNTCASREAKKIRHKILRDIEQLKKSSSGKTEEEQLKLLEENMAQYVKLLLAHR